MGKADLERYRGEVLLLAEKLALPSPSEDVVWGVYAETEKLIAMLRFRLDHETPGVFTKLPEASDMAHLLEDARELLTKASEEIARDRLPASIATLRKARNDLRSYLTEKSKSATKGRKTLAPSSPEGVATRK
ncbi:MAG: hypothetical protein OK442_02790 [Thaumarchaeota archaeon]|nr:hypothetical protein [Nitrososphaerota archaeon]